MISVIIPVYNTEKFLPKCLDSFLNQTFKGDIEIIVVNDGSPDNSDKVINEYIKKYPKIIKCIDKENGGLSSARNVGIEKANGDYICFFDSDDWVKEDYLEKLYNSLIENDSDISSCNLIKIWDDGKELLVKYGLGYTTDPMKEYVIAYPMVTQHLFKKKIFNSRRFKEKIYYEDLELVPSLILDAKNVSYVDEGLAYYYQREGSIMYERKFNKKLLDIFTVLDSVSNKFKDKGYDEEIEYLYITHLLRSATLRFLTYDETSMYLYKINDIIKDKYPNWRKNKYYKKCSIKLKIVCNLAYNKQFKLLKLVGRRG